MECFSSQEVVREYGLAVYQAHLRAAQRVVWEFTTVRAFGYTFPCIPAAAPLNQYSLEVLGLKINVMCNLKGELLAMQCHSVLGVTQSASGLEDANSLMLAPPFTAPPIPHELLGKA